MARPKKRNFKKLTPLETDLLEAANSMLSHHKGKQQFPSISYYKVPEEIDVKKIRLKLHLTQEQFANFIGASIHAVRHWENGRRKPDGTARTLLFILQRNPRAVLDVFEL